MDITTISTVSGSTQSIRIPVIHTADNTPFPSQQAQAESANVAAYGSSQHSEQDAVAKAAADAPFNYPLGSKTFTLYKDAAGQMITRYVSLIDGSVTYVPAPVYIKPVPQVSLDV